MRDTRYFHKFKTDTIERETSIKEITFQELSQLGKSIDPKEYKDPNIVATLLKPSSSMPSILYQRMSIR